MNPQLDLFKGDIPDRQTYGLEENKKWLINNMQKPGGCKCPLCEQHVQVYRRPITSSMAKALILIYRYYLKHDFFKSLQVEGYLKRCNVGSTIRGDFPKLRFWGLIRKSEEKKQRQGHYYLTQLGKHFVEEKIKVKKYAIVFNNQAWSLEGEEIGIKDTLKNPFDYNQLMQGEI